MKGKKAKALLAMLLAVQMAASGATVAFAQGATLDVAPQPSQVLVEEQEGVVYLSDLQWTDMTTAWGEPQKDQGLDENPIQFRDGNGDHIVYEKGICIHAPSSLTYSIENMGVEAFEAVVGIHDGDNNDKKEKSSCEFVVEIDGEEAYRSDVRKMDSGPLPIHVDIPADAKTLTLITTDGGDGDKQGDHSTWADAKLLLDESILQNLKSISLQADNQMLQPGEQVPVSVSGTLVNGDAAVFAPFDYVALGHIHAASGPQRAGKTYYAWPGCPEGRGFDETGDKGVYLGQLEGGHVSLEFVPLARRRYLTPEVDITGQDPAQALTAFLQTARSEDIVRLALVGERDPDREPDLTALTALASGYFYSASLTDRTTLPQALWARQGEDTLTGLFLRTMAQRIQEAPADQRPLLERAVRFGLAALEGREEPQ